MKKHIFTLILIVCLCVALVVSISACANSNDDGSNDAGNAGNSGNTGNSGNSGSQLNEFKGITFSNQVFEYDGNEHTITVSGSVPSEANVAYSNNKATLPGTYSAKATITAEGYKSLTLNAVMTIKATEQSFVSAAKNSAELNKQEYDYKFNIQGKANILGFTGAVNGNYDGQYRYDKSNDNLQFKRVTSGVLFYDSTKYIVNKGDQKITLTQDEDGNVKKVKVASAEDETSLINREFETLINSLKPEHIENLKSSTASGYQYQFNINAQSSNAITNTLLKVVKNLGLNISIKNITITNPLSGVVVYFNFDSTTLKIKDYKLGLEIKTPIKAVETALTLTYEQHNNTSNFSLPNVADFKFTDSDISAELSKINNALAALKNDDAYSLDLSASNEFDPGVTTWATKDSFTSRFYKNTKNDFVSFNNSYEYKTHHEEDGKETYKYTVGNIQDGNVYMISRKGKNTTTELNNVTQDKIFDDMTRPFIYSSNQVDCIKMDTKNGVTTYYIYLNKQSTLNVADKICDIINSNNAEGVIEVDNYFNHEEYDIVGADMIVKMEGNALKEISIETNIKYNPTDGEYTDRNIKLTDILTLEINAKLDKAQKYDAPKKADGPISNLDYIL